MDDREISRSRAKGVASGIGAGALWGLVFVAPELAGDFSPLLLSIGRYLVYGLISVLLIGPRLGVMARTINARDWLTLAWLAASGNILYYILLSSAVQLSGIALTSLVIGFMPVAVTLVGSRDHGAVPLGRLVPSIGFCLAGAVCIGWQALPFAGEGASGASLAGFLCAIGALASWTAFAVGNARALARITLSGHDWNLLTGVMTGAMALMLLPIAFLLGPGSHEPAAWLRFGLISIGVALLASIAGNALWNHMSRLLPLTLVGQMILFETLFALLYAFAWEARLPTPLEALSFLFISLGVATCIAAHRRGTVVAAAPT